MTRAKTAPPHRAHFANLVEHSSSGLAIAESGHPSEDRDSLRDYLPHPEHEPAAAMVKATFERIVVLDLSL